MAKLSNINGKFAVEDTGAIRFSDQTGTTGQILKSNGNAAPTWVDPNTVGTGPWLPLAGGIVSGPTTFQSSLTVGSTLTVNAGTYHKLIATFPSTYKTNLQIGQQLNISNDAITDTVTFAHTGTEAASDFIFTVAGNEKLKIGGNGSLDVTSTSSDAVFLRSSQATTTNVYITNTNATVNNTANLYFAPANNIAGSYIKSTAIEDFSTSANRTSDLRFAVRKDGTFNEALIIDSSGNVGIGIDTPTLVAGKIVHIHGTAAGVHLTDTASGTTSGDGGYVAFDNPNLYIQNKEAGSMFFETSGTTALTIDSNGDSTFAGSITGGTTIGTAKIIMQVDGTLDWGNAKDFGTLTWDTGYAIIAGQASKGLKLRTNDSTDALTIDTFQNATFAGNVGIGTTPITSPNSADTSLSIFSGQDCSIILKDSVETWEIYQNDDLHFSYGSTPSTVMTMQRTTGNVGIGTTSPSQKLVVQADWNGSLSNNQQLQIQGNTDTTLQLRLGYDTTNDYAEIAAIKSGTGYKNLILNRGGANVGIGTPSPSAKLEVQMNAASTFHSFFQNNNVSGYGAGFQSNSGIQVYFYDTGGNIGSITSNGSNTSYNTSGSDERLKENIEVWDENVLDKFKNLQPKTFNFIKHKQNNKTVKGYIAQNEVDNFPEAYPMVYDIDAEKDMYQFNPSGMTVYLMKAIQELKAEIDDLKNK